MQKAGLGLAIPGILDVIVRGSHVLFGTVDTFQKMDETIARFRQTTLDIKEGDLYFCLEDFRRVSRDHAIPAAIKDQLDATLAQMNIELAKSMESLRAVEYDSWTARLRYTVWKGRGSHDELLNCWRSLDQACTRLRRLRNQINIHQNSTSSHLLTSDVFKVKRETTECSAITVLPDSDIETADCSYVLDGKRGKGQFVLEKKYRENDVKFLCSKLNEAGNAPVTGTLPILGYRQPPYQEPHPPFRPFFQLVMELPELPSSTQWVSLAHLISTRRVPTLMHRLELCIELCRKVAMVHSLDLVHKSIRPRAILVAHAQHGDNPSPSVYLQDWSYIRSVSGATTQLGETVWHKRIYQHPERQQQFAETEYSGYHDLYSLGVCLLEILLWTPFVVSDACSNLPEQICSIFEDCGLALGEDNTGLPQRYKGNPCKLASRPLATRQIWCSISNVKLSKIDLGLSQAVTGCLEEGFETASELMEYLGNVKSVL